MISSYVYMFLDLEEAEAQNAQPLFLKNLQAIWMHVIIYWQS